MGPDSNKMLKPGFKSLLSMLALCSMEIRDRNRLKVKDKVRERPGQLATNQVEQFYCQPLGQEKGKS